MYLGSSYNEYGGWEYALFAEVSPLRSGIQYTSTQKTILRAVLRRRLGDDNVGNRGHI